MAAASAKRRVGNGPPQIIVQADPIPAVVVFDDRIGEVRQISAKVQTGYGARSAGIAISKPFPFIFSMLAVDQSPFSKRLATAALAFAHG